MVVSRTDSRPAQSPAPESVPRQSWYAATRVRWARRKWLGVPLLALIPALAAATSPRGCPSWRIRYWMLTDTPQLFFRLMHQPWYEGMLLDWTAALPVGPTDDVLDLGCGPGVLTLDLAPQTRSSTGIDRSTDMLAVARREEAKHPTGARFVQADVTATGLASACADVVVGASILNVLPSPIDCVREATRLCRDGGVVSFLVPTPQMQRDTADAFIVRQRLSGLSAAFLRTWAGVSKKMEATDVAQWMRSSGLSDVRFTEHLEGMVATVTGTKAERPRASP